MKIAVCIKQVPNTEARLRVSRDGRWLEEEDLPFVINESDEYALEEGLRIAEKTGGEVVVFSLGPERVKEALRKALAVGAARAVHLSDPAFAGRRRPGDRPGARRRPGARAFDLVLTGSQSDDVGYGGTGSVIAGHLGWPHVWLVMGVELEEGNQTAKVTREMESGVNEVSRVRLPAVLEIQAGHQPPALRLAQGDHGGQEEGDRRRRARPTSGSTPGRWGRRARGWRSSRWPSRQSGNGAQMLEGDAKAAAAKPGRETAEGSEGALMANRVWVVLQQREGQVSRISWEAVAAAQKLAARPRAARPRPCCSAPASASPRPRWRSCDLAAVHVADHEALRAYTPGGYIGALAPAIRARGSGLRGLSPHLPDGRLHAPPGAGDRRRPAARGDRFRGRRTAACSGPGR